MNLRQLSIRVLETRGLVRQSNLQSLRHRLLRQPSESLLKEVNDCDTPRQLRVLWEAGLNNELQEAVTKRLERIT